jgi:hypothetical protein
LEVTRRHSWICLGVEVEPLLEDTSEERRGSAHPKGPSSYGKNAGIRGIYLIDY